jgi:hypothetical protein
MEYFCNRGGAIRFLYAQGQISAEQNESTELNGLGNNKHPLSGSPAQQPCRRLGLPDCSESGAAVLQFI